MSEQNKLKSMCRKKERAEISYKAPERINLTTQQNVKNKNETHVDRTATNFGISQSLAHFKHKIRVYYSCNDNSSRAAVIL